MPSLNVKTLFDITLNSNELRLVLKALDGRALTDEESKEAKELSYELARMRANSMKSVTESNEKLIRNLDKRGSD